jgi:RNA polymerase sigma-70 factor (ECF subfamily)
MSERSTEQIRELLDSLYRVDSGRILATLIRLLGDFDLAEEAMHEAFAAALSLWPRSGVPGNPRPRLISTARFKAIDTLRRRARFDASQDELVRYLEAQWSSAERSNEEDSLEDDRLRLIFTCCHPSLPPEAHVALTLREVCGLTTEEIAKAFLITPRALAQRIVRAKAKIRETPIPYEVPTPQELPERLGAVLQVIYLVFNEGYSAAAGAEVTRAELTGEAIRLGRLLTELRPEPEVIGLLSLMLLQESRHAARTSPTGELILLENQDRSLWNREQIAEGWALVEKALKSRRFGSYTLQAAIAAVHAEAESVAVTDWGQIVALYNRLDGEFRIGALKPGSYFIGAFFDFLGKRDVATVKKGYLPVYYPSVAFLSSATPVCVGAGQQVRVGFKLNPRVTHHARAKLILPASFKRNFEPINGLRGEYGQLLTDWEEEYDHGSSTLTVTRLAPGSYDLDTATAFTPRTWPLDCGSR